MNIRTAIFLGIGLLLLIFGVKIKFTDDFKNIVFVEGTITYYHFYYSGKRKNKLEGVIHLDTFKKNAETWTEGDRHFNFLHIESFNREKFESNGGGLGAKVSIGVDRPHLEDIEYPSIPILQLVLNGENYINKSKFKSLRTEHTNFLIIFGGLSFLYATYEIFKGRINKLLNL